MLSSARLRIVYLEDDQSAFELVSSLLAAEGFAGQVEHVLDEADYRAALAPIAPDLILSDYSLPTMDGKTALDLRRELCPATPFIFVSGALGEAMAIDLLKAGVTDFVFKDALPRLVPSIRRCLAEAKEHSKRLRAEESLRESEARFRRLAENAPDVIFRYNLDTTPGRCEFISAAVERLTGYQPEEFYEDPQLPVKFVHPDDRHIVLSIIQHRQIPGIAAEIRWITRDGRIIVTDQRFVPVYDADNRLVALEGIARDVTQVKGDAERRRSLETQLFQAQKMESIGTLAGGIAHDFNNILTGILGFTEIAALSLKTDDPARGSLEEVRKAGLRARDLVAQILTFSRQKETRHVALDLSRAVGEALKFLRASAPATIKIERHLAGGTVNADPTQIHQIVLNLCTNAIHSMRDRPGTLFVAVEPVAVDETLAATMPKVAIGNYLCLVVRDAGHGMDETTLRRVFDPFFTTKQPGEGTGLGLPVVQGSTFRVYLPASNQAEQPASEVARVAPGRGEHVLVVDDESSVGAFTGVRLEQYNYRVLVYDDPRRALASVRANPQKFDALVTDLTMPGLTGVDLVRELRAAGVAIPVVIMTGNRATVPASLLATMKDVALVEKPFAGEDLTRALRLLLDQRTP